MADEQSSGVEPALARHGKLSYVQIPAADTAALAAFYREVFGWAVEGGGPDHRSFADASGPGGMIGAFVTAHAPAAPGILPYIYVTGIDAAVGRIVAHGGEIVREVYPEGSLRVALFRDPAGNTLGVWEG